MPGASRNNDLIIHDGVEAKIIASGNNFIIENKATALKNDPTEEHSGHIGYLIGEHNFYINNKSIQIIGDPVDCGGTIETGSSTFIIGG